jgi:hypothetical protein
MVTASLLVAEGSLPALQIATFLLFPQMMGRERERERERKRFCISSLSDIDLSLRIHLLFTSQRYHVQVSSY